MARRSLHRSPEQFVGLTEKELDKKKSVAKKKK
jgi:hypothetical protein